MDLRQSIDQYQRQFERGVDAGERDERAVALEVLQEFLSDDAALQTLEALTVADLEELFVEWYLQQPGATADFAVTLLDAARGWLAWSDAAYGLTQGAAFQPLYDRLRVDLPRILEAGAILAAQLRQSRAEDAREAGLDELATAPTAGLLSSGLNRVLRPEEIDYAAARDDYFCIERIDGSALVLQSAAGSELGEAAVGPVRVPKRAAALLRVGDVLYVEVAPGRQGWEILEVSRVLPAGYQATRRYGGSAIRQSGSETFGDGKRERER